MIRAPRVLLQLIAGEVRSAYGISPERYLFRAVSVGLLGGAAFTALLSLRASEEAAVAGGLAFLLLTLLAARALPRARMAARVAAADSHLLLAVRELGLLLKAGYPLQDALIHLSHGHGEVSRQLGLLARDIESARPLGECFGAARMRTSPQALLRLLSLLEGGFRSGSSLEVSLNALVSDLANDQRSRIESYTRELNVWSMAYLLLAVAIPTIGAVMLLVLGAFAAGAEIPGFHLFVIGSIGMQVLMLMTLRTRRPVVT